MSLRQDPPCEQRMKFFPATCPCNMSPRVSRPWAGVRDFVTPQTMFAVSFSFFVHGSTRYSKNGIPDQTDGIYTLFKTKMAKSITLFQTRNAWKWYPLGRHIPIWLNIWEYPPPPPRGTFTSRLAWVNVLVYYRRQRSQGGLTNAHTMETRAFVNLSASLFSSALLLLPDLPFEYPFT